MASTAVSFLTKNAIEGFAEYEQLVGGVQTLFKDSSGQLMQYARDAFKTAGMSANEYMNTATSFAASLIQSLGGDTKKAVDYADMAIRDMSDNENKFGTGMEAIQFAYQGFAKQNYTMLDNLKLGYGGTQSEMKRLLADAEAIKTAQGELAEYSIDSYADIVEAIHVVQQNMDVTGTTASEAAETISGSLAMTKAAWTNLMTGIADDTQDFDVLLNDLVTSATIAAENLMPRIEQALSGIGKLVEGLAPVLAAAVPGLVENVVPQLLSAGASMVGALGVAIVNSIPMLVDAAGRIAVQLAGYLAENTDAVVEGAVSIITALSTGIITYLPQLAEIAGQIIVQLVVALVSNTPQLLGAAGQIVLAFIAGILAFLGGIATTGGQMLDALIAAAMAKAGELINVAAAAIADFISGLVGKLGELKEKGKAIVNAVKDGIMGVVGDAVSWGSDLISNFISGLQAKWSALKQKVSDIAQSIRDLIGFSEPEEGPLSNFHTYAPDMMKLFAQGIRDNTRLVTDQITKSFDFRDMIVAPENMGELPAGRGVRGGVQITINAPSIDQSMIDYIVNTVSRELGWALA